MKWPNSWKKMMTPRTMMNDRRLKRNSISNLGHRPRGMGLQHAARLLAGPRVRGQHVVQRVDGLRPVGVHDGEDGLRDRGEGDALAEEGGHRLLVGGIQDR